MVSFDVLWCVAVYFDVVLWCIVVSNDVVLRCVVECCGVF